MIRIYPTDSQDVGSAVKPPACLVPLLCIVDLTGLDVGLSTGCPISRGFLQFLHKRSLSYLKKARKLFVVGRVAQSV